MLESMSLLSENRLGQIFFHQVYIIIRTLTEVLGWVDFSFFVILSLILSHPYPTLHPGVLHVISIREIQITKF